MKCPNCSAECSDQAQVCDFCGYDFIQTDAQSGESSASVEPPAPPSSPAPPPFTAQASAPMPPPANPYESAAQSTRPSEPIPNHMAWAIVSTVIATLVTMLTCCCLPLGLPSGIAAIVYAMRVNKHFEIGDITGALAASKAAKTWCWVTTALAIIFSVLLVFSLMVNGMDMMNPEALENLRKQIEAGR